MVDVVDLVRGDTHVIARLKIADLYRTPRSVYVFGRFRGRESGDGLVVGLNDDVALSNAPQHSSERGLAKTGNSGQQEKGQYGRETASHDLPGRIS
ncbi:MAG: hypothetical protein ABSE57_32765 [Bryobacteraceae bacterium]|jgi:hypothetical protein